MTARAQSRLTHLFAAIAVVFALSGCSKDDLPAGPGAPSGAACDDATPCPSGELCANGTCISASAGCPAATTMCGGFCCDATMACERGQCVASTACAVTERPCGTMCCDSAQECVNGACDTACPTVRCGAVRTCCNSGETCLDSTTCCEPIKHCGNVCCGADQLCETGTCRRDCGGRPPCGPQEACCGQDEVCYLDQCVAPGQPCMAGGCATRPGETTCPRGEFCDPGLGRCLPDRANQTCEYRPPVGVFDPVPLFTWGQRRPRGCQNRGDCQTAEICAATSSCAVTWSHVLPAGDDLPEYHQSSSIPMVADLDHDCVPEIVFNTYRNSDFTTDGILRAIRGDTGAKVWTVTDPQYRTNSTANPALGDLDGDGAAEIIVQGAGRYLLAFDTDGTPLWRSAPFSGNPAASGSAAIANLDAEGDAEIVFGATIYDSAGQLLFQGADGTGTPGQGPVSCVADLDGDGRPEVIAGRTVYETTGTVAGGNFAASVRWNAMAPDGYCGIADFTGDLAPEVVLVSNGVIYVLGGQIGNTLAQLTIPGGGQGGAPNIADFDGDGTPDIGTAGASNYVVAAYDGPSQLRLLWRAPTEDDSSSRTGSSVFDFDGDGRAEVVYNDEEFLRIYPGIEPDCTMSPPGPLCDGIMTDDEILFRDLNSSRTRTEYPVIADVNGDFKAEIVFATSNEATFLDPDLVGDAGIEVWRDQLDNWVATRPVWNQHSYHITNVETVGQIPRIELPSWRVPPDQPHNSYRRNTQGDRSFCAPDLQLRAIESKPACPDLEIAVWVVNAGCLGVGPGVNVSFYEDLRGLLGTVQTRGALIGGAAEQVTLRITDLPMEFDYRIIARVDDNGSMAGALNECEEANNESGAVTAMCRVDL